MSSTEVEIITSQLQTKSAWDIRLGEGSFLTMEFGSPESNPSGSRAHGEWHLWLYMCNWRIETDDKVLVGSDDDRETIQSVLKTAVFGETKTVQVVAPSKDLSINFASGLKVHTFSSSSDRDEEQWKLFTPEGKVLVMYGDGTWQYVDTNEASGAALKHRAR